MGERGFLVPVGREAEVDDDRAAVGDDVARDAAFDAHGVEALAIFAAVDRHASSSVRRQSRQHFTRPVDGVVAKPRAGAVRSLAGYDDQDPQRSLAAGLHAVGGRLHEDREIGLEPVRRVACHPAEAVTHRVGLLVVVEQPADVVPRRRAGGGDPEHHGQSRLHVRGAAAEQALSVTPAGQIVRDGHGVEVSGDDDALVATEVGPGGDRVAVAFDF